MAMFIPKSMERASIWAFGWLMNISLQARAVRQNPVKKIDRQMNDRTTDTLFMDVLSLTNIIDKTSFNGEEI
jgi:hypothetical protein